MLTKNSSTISALDQAITREAMFYRDDSKIAVQADVSAALHRYIELILDSSSVQGFDMNDSGSVLLENQ